MSGSAGNAPISSADGGGGRPSAFLSAVRGRAFFQGAWMWIAVHSTQCVFIVIAVLVVVLG